MPLIPLHSLYSPLQPLNYTLQNTPLPQTTHFHKLTLHLSTNPSITPQHSLSLPPKIITQHFNIFLTLTHHPQNPQIIIQKQQHQKQKLLQMSIQQLHLSVRSYNSLKPPPINSVQ
ncbi:DNA-directed RNA polymerase subunit alpha C-terminal domain-containing protein, partial [Staphylococcus epidermidis]|uniref:DNA-directed RNA polymerase subunit alpha C-terminal domain-containing protein n=1 Tax=Staphylococcus epidermidis TaxID=1282 RepID=UPI0037DA39DD